MFSRAQGLGPHEKHMRPKRTGLPDFLCQDSKLWGRLPALPICKSRSARPTAQRSWLQSQEAQAPTRLHCLLAVAIWGNYLNLSEPEPLTSNIESNNIHFQGLLHELNELLADVYLPPAPGTVPNAWHLFPSSSLTRNLHERDAIVISLIGKETAKRGSETLLKVPQRVVVGLEGRPRQSGTRTRMPVTRCCSCNWAALCPALWSSFVYDRITFSHLFL